MMLAPLLAVVAAQSPPVHQQTIEVRTVVVDIVVIDADGAFVSGLEADDFRVYEDDEERPIESVREIHHTRLDEEADASALAGLLPQERPPPRSVVFFFDFSYLTTRSRHGLRRAGAAALDWARDHLAHDDRISALAYDGKLRMLVEDRPFTGEIADMLAVLTFNEPSPWFDEARAEQLEPILIRPREVRRRTEMEERRLFDRLIDSLGWLAARLEGRSGRKAVLLFSERQILTKRARDALRDQVFVRMQEADAAIYYVHTPGLEPSGRTASEGPALRGDPAVGGADAGLDIMTFVTEQTGGRVTRNTNDFPGELRTVTSDLGSYYQLSYTPPDHDPGSRHAIRIEVDRADVAVRHRRGYRAPVARSADDEADRELDLASLLGARAGATPYLSDARVVAFPRSGGAWLGLLGRFPGELFSESSADVKKLLIRAEIRDHLGVSVATLDDDVTLKVTGPMRAALVERGLEYMGEVAVPANATEIRFVMRDGDMRMLALDTLRFDVSGRVSTLFVVDTAAPPVRVRGNVDAGAPSGRLTVGERRLHPRPGGRAGAGEAILVALELGPGEKRADDELVFEVLDGDAPHDVAGTRWSHDRDELRSLVLAEMTLPALPSGPYRLRVTGTLHGAPLVATTAIRLE